jgi:hypothetical protein
MGRLGLLLAALLLGPTAPRGAAGGGDELDYAREVRPILSRHCFKCHGPDEGSRKAKLRLDRREDAVQPRKGGRRAIAPGKPEESVLLSKILSADESELMPPPEVKNPLSAAQKEVLRRWIAAGAEYTPHWAFLPPRPPPLPAVRRKEWPRTPIDRFVLARLEAAGLDPQPEADRLTLARRLWLDLLGLPPTPEEADAFANDPSPQAYENLVDRLLASPHYGERWARKWLDLARYADTNGYEKDRPRSIWPYRDWVIRAINDDLPFDRFTIEQLAGDMLPGAGPEQRIATGFHRNTMLNEEGGIDPLEFRFHALTDRVATTGRAWLGLTLGCAQCHTHKFDPITHREYYSFFALLNNADEPELEVPVPDRVARRAELEARIAALSAELPGKFPAEDVRWAPASGTVASEGGARAEAQPDGSWRLTGPDPDQDAYTIVLETSAEEVDRLLLEALADKAFPHGGCGRSPSGNFVLSELTVRAGPKGAPDRARPVALARAEASFSQDGFPVAHAIDGDAKTGWAVHDPKGWGNRQATFWFAKPVRSAGGVRLEVRLEQRYGTKHTIGRLRLAPGRAVHDDRPLDVRRREHRDRRFREWLAREEAAAVPWTPLRPAAAKANLPHLTVLEDASVLAGGDMTKLDVYDLAFRGDFRGVTAIRLEALPDERLPRRGPGRVYYEGPSGDFKLSEFAAAVAGRPVTFARALHSFASGNFTAAAAIDGDPRTGWSVNGGQGRRHVAVFVPAAPLDGGGELSVRLLFEHYYAAGLGRFRVSVTTAPPPSRLSERPAEIEALLLTPADRRSPDETRRLLEHFASGAPELASERAALDALRRQMPSLPTTLVFSERPPENPRPTHLHRRGEFLQPQERVEPGVPAVLPPLPAGAPADRLALARWLVSPDHPLTSRVTVNRHWAAFFGRGIVRTVDDFGLQGELPTHPELLDWLALEFVKRKWSVKALHKLIVLSAAYRQGSLVTREHLARDPDNRLLGRAPRVRVDAETVRDAALRASGLLSAKIGGPSVFPPQPPAVTTEGAYGSLAWTVSAGEDRYRRGLYTFMKRTAPYAMFSTFDGPSGEIGVAQREVSNTPLQALTLLNDAVFVEAAQAMARSLAGGAGTVEERVAHAFRRCLTRPPDAAERELLARFFRTQKDRFERKELDAAAVGGAGAGDANERAAWTTLVRALFNLDEFITKG